MRIDEIKSHLIDAHENFISSIEVLGEEEFAFTPEGKWNAGQQLDHIYRSVFAFSIGLRFPKALLKISFGKANRVSRDYDQLVERYQQRLAGGGAKATGRFIPKPVLFVQKINWIKKLHGSVVNLCRYTDQYSEEQLDEYILPHPLLGKITVREMLYFTIYHVQHHQRLMIKNLALKKGQA